jgi:hypothetical protein
VNDRNNQLTRLIALSSLGWIALSSLGWTGGIDDIQGANVISLVVPAARRHRCDLDSAACAPVAS